MKPLRLIDAIALAFLAWFILAALLSSGRSHVNENRNRNSDRERRE